MTITPLTPDQTDALQEVVNIAMGQAGASLAQILDHFVHLSIPKIRVIEVSDVGNSVIDMVGHNSEMTAVRQAFYNQLRGEAIVLFGQNGCKDLADLMGYDQKLNTEEEQELLLDVANILVGAILNGITQTLKTELGFSAPSIMAQNTHIDSVISSDNLSWTHALLLEVNFSLEKRDFKSHLLLLLAEDAIDTLRRRVDEFMDSV